MNLRDLECQTINPCICNSLYRHIFLINHYCLFVCLFEVFTASEEANAGLVYQISDGITTAAITKKSSAMTNVSK